MKNSIISLYKEQFNASPDYVVRSPGRVNLIGDHTDYNDGFVLPMAICHAVWIAFTPTDDNTVSLYSKDFNESLSFSLNAIENSGQGWLEYIKGVASGLQSRDLPLKGFKGVIKSDLPIGAGLSSSAALEMGAIKCLLQENESKLSTSEMALLGQWVENSWIGLNCGIMDQLISAGGEEDHALFLDCRSLESKPIRIPDEALIAVLDTTTRRELTGSAYNERRQQCEAAAKMLGVASLRDLTLDHLKANRSKLDQIVANRAMHVVTENARVERTSRELQQKDLAAVGKLFVESHQSLRDLFEISSPALNQMSDSALKSRGCYGARMTGGGFAGCAVAIIDREKKEVFQEDVEKYYFDLTGMKPAIYISDAFPGTELIRLED